jgi:hypothetical protein
MSQTSTVGETRLSLCRGDSRDFSTVGRVISLRSGGWPIFHCTTHRGGAPSLRFFQGWAAALPAQFSSVLHCPLCTPSSYPPFAKNAKDGAPTCMGAFGDVESLGHPLTSRSGMVRNGFQTINKGHPYPTVHTSILTFVSMVRSRTLCTVAIRNRTEECAS